MRPSQLWHLVRMSIGSVLGIIGFGTLSLGFVHLSGVGMVLGFVEILLGAFIALSVMSPLRKHRA